MEQEQNNQYKKLKQTIGSVDENTLKTVLKDTNKVIDPWRKTALQRFPTLFLLLTAFGVVTTFYGFERLIESWPFLYDRPFLILFIGLVALLFTGGLYKKLG